MLEDALQAAGASQRTLLLNGGYEPLLVISWKRAIGLQVSDKAEVVEVYDCVVCSPSRIFQVPAVIRLHGHLCIRAPGVRFSRRNVFIRDDFTCQYCRRRFDARFLTLDHVVPRRAGGRTTWTNIVTACGRCNRRKGGRTPAQAEMPLCASPVRPAWMPAGRDGQVCVAVPDQWRLYLAA